METILISIETHIIVIFIFLALMVLNLYNSFAEIGFYELRNRLKISTPLFHTLNTIVIYTGVIVSAFNHDISFAIILMIAASIFVMILEIKRNKKMRVIRSTDIQLQKEFKQYSQKIYSMEIITIITAYILSKLIITYSLF
jgi:hypothetical protein